MNTYQFPMSYGFVFEVKANSIEEAIERAKVRLNTTEPPKPTVIKG